MKAISDVKLNYMVQKILRLINKKQSSLTFDNAPALGSSNPVTSDGIAKAMASNVVDPFVERTVEIVAVNFDKPYNIVYSSEKVSNSGLYIETIAELPIPIDLDLYAYEFKIKYYGLSSTWTNESINGDTVYGLSFELTNKNNENDDSSNALKIATSPSYTTKENSELSKEMATYTAEETIFIRKNGRNDPHGAYIQNRYFGYYKGPFLDGAINYYNKFLRTSDSSEEVKFDRIRLTVPQYDVEESSESNLELPETVTDISKSVKFGTYGITFTYRAVPYDYSFQTLR